MSGVEHWNKRYQEGDSPWDTGQPSGELRRVLHEEGIAPCRALELGCGTGTNAVWLAQQGFDVTAVDLAPLAIERAEARAQTAGVKVRFVKASAFELPDLGGPFPFFFDRGCYHVVRRIDAGGYVRTLERVTAPGSVGLVLAGNAREPHDPGPPVVSEAEIREELGRVFEIVRLREFRFDSAPDVGVQFLAWSCLIKRAEKNHGTHGKRGKN
jgi:SAM-dependent methyltransferase